MLFPRRSMFTRLRPALQSRTSILPQLPCASRRFNSSESNAIATAPDSGDRDTTTPSDPVSEKPLAIITGGSRGIGLGIAHAFSKQGYDITIISRNPPADGLPEEWTHIPGSVVSNDTWAQLKKHKGCPHVLVNAAGVSQSGLFFQSSAATLSILDTNLRGTMFGTSSVLKTMMQALRKGHAFRHSPCIINISSLLALKGEVGTSIYAASKAGVLGFTRATALEFGGRGIRVNAIVPGYIETDMTKDLSPARRAAILKKIPMKDARFGTVEEIAEAALFLAKNEYANNCTINLDGGLSAT